MPKVQQLPDCEIQRKSLKCFLEILLRKSELNSWSLCFIPYVRMCFLLGYCKSLGMECPNKAVGPPPGLKGFLLGFLTSPNAHDAASVEGVVWLVYQSVALGSRHFHTVAEASSHPTMPRGAEFFPTWSSLQLYQLLSLLSPLHSLSWGSPYHRGASQSSLLTQHKCYLFSYYPPRLVFCHFTKLGYCIDMPELNPEEQWQSVVGEKKWEGPSSYLAVVSC